MFGTVYIHRTCADFWILFTVKSIFTDPTHSPIIHLSKAVVVKLIKKKTVSNGHTAWSSMGSKTKGRQHNGTE